MNILQKAFESNDSNLKIELEKYKKLDKDLSMLRLHSMDNFNFFLLFFPSLFVGASIAEETQSIFERILVYIIAILIAYILTRDIKIIEKRIERKKQLKVIKKVINKIYEK